MYQYKMSDIIIHINTSSFKMPDTSSDDKENWIFSTYFNEGPQQKNCKNPVKLILKWKSRKISSLKFDLNKNKSSFNPLKTKKTWDLFNDSVHTAQEVRIASVIKTNYLVPYREIIAAGSEIHTEHTLLVECKIFEC
jgi:hypothetical protein